MKKWFGPILPWLLPLVFIGLMVGLTIPWTYWVIQAANDRDVQENAKMLGSHVAIRVLSDTSGKAQSGLVAELYPESAVEVCVYVDLRNPSAIIPWARNSGRALPTWAAPPDGEKVKEIIDKLLKRRGTIQTQDDKSFYFYVPCILHIQANSSDTLIGFTYMEMSREALANEFKVKEGPLVKRVETLSAIAMLVLSAVALLAFWIWVRSARVRQRAELERLGVRAERGLTAAVLAHEIRNPLAALRFQLHSLRANVADTARVSSTADTIDGELLRIQQLVTDYLEHERARSMRVQSVDLTDAARKLQTLLAELFRQGDTHLSVVAAPEPVVVTCDPHALRQILMNLVINAQQAIKGRRDGKLVDGSIVLRIGCVEGFGAIDVADNGPGIPPEMRERIFKPFQTTKREGHGIGLALVKRFVDNFGGSVSVDSELGRGTTFRLRLPLAGADADHHAPTDGVQKAEPLKV